MSDSGTHYAPEPAATPGAAAALVTLALVARRFPCSPRSV
jgi:hypothetical protein